MPRAAPGGTRRTQRLTRDTSIVVGNFSISDDGRWIAFRGTSSDRYKRNVTEENIYADQYLLEVASGQIERLTNNAEVGESVPSFSPDGQWIAYVTHHCGTDCWLDIFMTKADGSTSGTRSTT